MELVDQGKEIQRRADEFNRAGNFEEAERLYDMLLTQNHDNPYLLATLGTLYLHDQRQRYGLAISLLERAAKALGTADILCNLGIAYRFANNQEKGDHYFKKAIDKHPTAQILANYGALFVGVGNPDEAIKIARRGLELDANCAIAHWNLGMALLEKGEWETAWDEHEWGLKSHMRIDRKIRDLPLWDGTPDKTVAVSGEQGIGDEIMFASMLPDLMQTNTVIFECHKRLQHLFEHSFPGLVCIGAREEKEISWPYEYEIDYRTSIGSLGKWFRRSKDSFPGTPYLDADPAQKGKKFRVGISWTGGFKAGRVAVRRVPLSWWKPILDNDCEFISLQYTECADELKMMEQAGYAIQQFPEVKADDYYETARLVKSCDLIISCCTSVIHLAGAMGVPCWVMTPNRPAWRYGIKGRMPWYRSVRLYRQPPGDSEAWLPVIEKVADDLRAKMEEEHPIIRVAYG